MSNPILSPNSLNATVNINSVNDLGENQMMLNQANMGINVKKAMSFQVDPGFAWIEPPISGILGYINPNESTYHPLLENTNYEIASNLFSVEGATTLSQEQKNIYKAKIKGIVENAYVIKEKGSIYKATIFLIIIIIVIMILLFIQGNSTIIYILSGFAVVSLLFIGYKYLIGIPTAIGDGIKDWNTFSNKLSSYTASGLTANNILNKFSENENTEMIQKKYDNLGMGTNASLQGSNPSVNISANFTNSIISGIGNAFSNMMFSKK
jgi:hypothetical protein